MLAACGCTQLCVQPLSSGDIRPHGRFWDQPCVGITLLSQNCHPHPCWRASLWMQSPERYRWQLGCTYWGMQGLSPNCSAAWGHTGTRGHGDTGTLGVWGQLGICHLQDTQRVTLRRNPSDPSSSDKSGGQQPASPRLLPTSMRKHIATTGATRVAAACPQGDRHHCRHQGPGSGIAAAISRAGCAVLDTASPWKPSRSGCAGSGDAISTETRGCAGRDARTVPGCCG